MSFYSSRSQPHADKNDETYTTINIYTSSQLGVTPLAGYTNINAGFTVQLANPIILDIDHRYVIALIKGQFDITDYTDTYHSFDINCDLIEFQYENNQKTQLLYQVYGCKYEPTGSSGNVNLALFEIANVVWKFINPTQKIISRMSFWVNDSLTKLPLTSPTPSLPTQFSVLIKKVNTHVIATSAL